MKGKFARTITVVAAGGLLVAGSGGVASASPASPAGARAAASTQAIPRHHHCPQGLLGGLGDLLDSLVYAVTGVVDGVFEPPHIP